MTRFPYPKIKRFFVVIGCYILAVLVASFVTTLLFSPNKAAPMIFVFGVMYVLMFASGPALIFITICEFVGHLNKWGYIAAGIIVALLAHWGLEIVEPSLFNGAKLTHLIVASMAGGAAGALTFWRLAVAPLKRQSLNVNLAHIFN